MGIKKFRANLKTFGIISKVTQKSRATQQPGAKQPQQRKQLIIYDFNSVIHNIHGKMKLYIEQFNPSLNIENIIDEELIFRCVDTEIENFRLLLNVYQPGMKTDEFLFLDGVCSFNKMNEQLHRKQQEFMHWNDAKSKSSTWIKNSIAPGTSFMRNLRAHLVDVKVAQGNTFKIDGDDSPGEAEHKISVYIQELIDSNEVFHYDDITVYSPDSDAYLLVLNLYCNALRSWMQKRQYLISDDDNVPYRMPQFHLLGFYLDVFARWMKSVKKLDEQAKQKGFDLSKYVIGVSGTNPKKSGGNDTQVRNDAQVDDAKANNLTTQKGLWAPAQHLVNQKPIMKDLVSVPTRIGGTFVGGATKHEQQAYNELKIPSIYNPVNYLDDALRIIDKAFNDKLQLEQNYPYEYASIDALFERFFEQHLAFVSNIRAFAQRKTTKIEFDAIFKNLNFDILRYDDKAAYQKKRAFYSSNFMGNLGKDGQWQSKVMDAFDRVAFMHNKVDGIQGEARNNKNAHNNNGIRRNTDIFIYDPYFIDVTIDCTKDIVLMLVFFGNDFIPRLPTFFFDIGELLWIIYCVFYSRYLKDKSIHENLQHMNMLHDYFGLVRTVEDYNLTQIQGQGQGQQRQGHQGQQRDYGRQGQRRGGAHSGRGSTSEELVNELFTLHLDTLLTTARGNKQPNIFHDKFAANQCYKVATYSLEKTWGLNVDVSQSFSQYVQSQVLHYYYSFYWMKRLYFDNVLIDWIYPYKHCPMINSLVIETRNEQDKSRKKEAFEKKMYVLQRGLNEMVAKLRPYTFMIEDAHTLDSDELRDKLQYYAVMQCKLVNQIRHTGYVDSDKKVNEINAKLAQMFQMPQYDDAENLYIRFYFYMLQREPLFWRHIHETKKEMLLHKTGINTYGGALRGGAAVQFNTIWPVIKANETNPSAEQTKMLQAFVDGWKDKVNAIRGKFIQALTKHKDFLSPVSATEDFDFDTKIEDFIQVMDAYQVLIVSIGFPKGILQYFNATVQQFDPQYITLSAPFAYGLLS